MEPVGPMFAGEIRKQRVAHTRCYRQWRWHLDEVFVKINGKLCYLWRAVDHEGEVLEAGVTARRDKAAALKLLKRITKKYGRPQKIVTDRLRAGLVRRNADSVWAMLASGHEQPFRYFNSSPGVIRLVVMMYVRYPLSLRNEDLLAERGIDISHETIRFWWNRFGPMFAAEIRKNRVARLRRFPQWR